MNVCIIRQLPYDQIVGVVEFPNGGNTSEILKDWCHMNGLSESAHFKYSISVFQVCPFSKLLDARKPCST